MWIGERITQSGIGNGISLIIFAGIVSGIPSAISNTINLVNTGELNFLSVLAIFAIIVLTNIYYHICGTWGEGEFQYRTLERHHANRD